jgi:hypothetical protein
MVERLKERWERSIGMRKRSPLVFASLVVLLGCVDTVTPTGPAPTPPEDGGGEITSTPAVSSDAGGQSATPDRRWRPTN